MEVEFLRKMRSLLLFFLFPVLVCAQDKTRELSNSDLMGTRFANLARGDSITLSDSLFICSDLGYSPSRMVIWIADSGKCEDDTVEVRLYGWFASDTTSCIDTLLIPLALNKRSVAEFSPTLPVGIGLLDSIKIGFTTEDRNADDSIWFFSKLTVQY